MPCRSASGWHDWASRYPLIVEGFDDTLAGYRRAARHRRHATLDSVPARRLRRCLGRSRAFVSGRGVSVCLDVAEAGAALRANGSLESIFEFLLVQPPRESPATSCSSMPARWGWRASSQSGWARAIAPVAPATGSSSRPGSNGGEAGGGRGLVEMTRLERSAQKMG